MKTYYRTAHNYNHEKIPGEINEDPSLTVPGETKTIQEILQRARSGMAPEQKNYPYIDVEDIQRINQYYRPGTLDLTDLEAMQKHSNELQSIVQKAAAKKRKEEQKEAEKNQLDIEDQIKDKEDQKEDGS